jgi:uncharacterized protein (DUF608 family)
MNPITSKIIYIPLLLLMISCNQKNNSERDRIFNGSYEGEYLSRVAFPMGGIGAGMVCLEGTGAISHLSVENQPDLFNDPFAFAAISIADYENGAKVLEAPVPKWKLFGTKGTGVGGGAMYYGYPHFNSGKFLPRFPFATLELEDKDIPLEVNLTGWSPFIPGDEDNSSLPACAIEYHFKNPTDKKIEAVFSYHAENFIDYGGRILEAQNGFKMIKSNGEYNNPASGSGFIINVDNKDAVVDYCWFRGGWYDSKTILWKNIKEMNMKNNPPVDESPPGASIYVPVLLEPGEEKTISVNFSWYFPETNLAYGNTPNTEDRREQEVCCINPYYKPWYAGRFKNVDEVARYWKINYAELKEKSERFRDAFFDSTLPDEVLEAVSANLTILKSPTVLRQDDGRLWCFEGSSDNRGCCAGSCTHVWNYAQAIPHLFPALERTLRETEFKVSQNEEGHQVFRTNLPISPTVHDFHSAADGQLGGIMKVYREWRISGNTDWLLELYPLVKKSLDYCINTWDPRHQGYLEEPHHNTYDIEFWGPNGMCTSFYLGALTAFVEMSKELNKPHDLYKTLLADGTKYMENELFNGEYFIQKVKWTGLNAPDPLEAISLHTNYSPEALGILKEEGPKYQYGSGCLSDGVVGMWIATVCGIEEVLDQKKVTSHLESVHKYNLKKDLSNHVCPQRSTYAIGKEGGLLNCTWPNGDEFSLPFVYSNEVWTGIEYQVASHLIFKGQVEKGLEIVRECRKRYDGRVRNPFNEIECGNWYARALASYGLIQSLTGIRYDAVEKTLYIDSKMGDDFKSFFAVDGGWGHAGLKGGTPFVEIIYGDVDVKKIIVSGVEVEI